jgi:hypothetical protein
MFTHAAHAFLCNKWFPLTGEGLTVMRENRSRSGPGLDLAAIAHFSNDTIMGRILLLIFNDVDDDGNVDDAWI